MSVGNFAEVYVELCFEPIADSLVSLWQCFHENEHLRQTSYDVIWCNMCWWTSITNHGHQWMNDLSIAGLVHDISFSMLKKPKVNPTLPLQIFSLLLHKWLTMETKRTYDHRSRIFFSACFFTVFLLMFYHWLSTFDVELLLRFVSFDLCSRGYFSIPRVE